MSRKNKRIISPKISDIKIINQSESKLPNLSFEILVQMEEYSFSQLSKLNKADLCEAINDFQKLISKMYSMSKHSDIFSCKGIYSGKYDCNNNYTNKLLAEIKSLVNVKIDKESIKDELIHFKSNKGDKFAIFGLSLNDTLYVVSFTPNHEYDPRN